MRVLMRHWRYFAAAMRTFPETQNPDLDFRCEGLDVRIDAVPIRLRYVFTFPSECGGHVWRKKCTIHRP